MRLRISCEIKYQDVRVSNASIASVSQPGVPVDILYFVVGNLDLGGY